MIRLWVTFLVCCILIHCGITVFRGMTGKQRWTLTKSLVYSIMIVLLTTMVLSAIVILF